MAVVHLGNQKYTCLAGDTKPTNVPVNAEAWESDTLEQYYFDGTNWLNRKSLKGNYVVYIDTADSNKIKARNLSTGNKLSTHATDAGVVMSAVVSALSTEGGGIIFIDRGTFYLASSVAIPTQSNIIFQGSGREVTKFVAVTAAMSMFHKSDLTPTNDITFRDLTVDGADIASRLLNTYQNITRLTIERCHFTRGSNNESVQMLISGVNDVSVRDSAFSFASGGGDLLAIGGNRIVVDGCYFTRSVSGAALTSGGYIDASITNNFFDNCNGYASISMENQSRQTERVYVGGNHIKSSNIGQCCIKILDSGGMSETVRPHSTIVINGNTITDSGFLRVEYFADQVIVCNNILDGMDGGGIQFVSNDYDIIISGNIIKNSLEGIKFSESSDILTYQDTKRVLITNNELYNITEDGIELRGNVFTKISNNMLYNIGIGTNATYRGIWLRTFSGRVNNKSVVENNFIDADAANKVLNAIECSSGTLESYIERNKINTGCFTNLAIQTNSAAGVITKYNTGYLTENKGSNTKNGGSTTVTIAHGLAATPTFVQVEPKSDDAMGNFKRSADATNITLTYPFATPSGTNNLDYYWRAEV